MSSRNRPGLVVGTPLFARHPYPLATHSFLQGGVLRECSRTCHRAERTCAARGASGGCLPAETREKLAESDAHRLVSTPGSLPRHRPARVHPSVSDTSPIGGGSACVVWRGKGSSSGWTLADRARLPGTGDLMAEQRPCVSAGLPCGDVKEGSFIMNQSGKVGGVP